MVTLHSTQLLQLPNVSNSVLRMTMTHNFDDIAVRHHALLPCHRIDKIRNV